MSNEIKKAKDNITDAVKEGIHKAKAESERDLRAERGDVMSTKDKAASIARETTEDTKAAVDRAKRKLREKM